MEKLFQAVSHLDSRRTSCGKLLRGQNHNHGAPFELGVLFHDSILYRLLRNPFEQFPSKVGEGDLPAPEDDGTFDLVLFRKELLDVADLGHQIMLAGFGADLDFLDLECTLLFFGLLHFFGLVVLETTVIHYLADRRIRVWGNLHKIKVVISCDGKCLVNCHYAELLAFGVDYPDLLGPDLPVGIYPFSPSYAVILPE